MKNFLENYKEFIVLVLYVLIIIGLFQFVIFPINEEIIEKKKTSEEVSIDYEVSLKKIKEIPVLKEKIDSVSYLEPKLNVFVEKGKELPLIESIEKIALETGSEIDIDILDDGIKDDDIKKTVKIDKEGIEIDLPSDNYILMKITIFGDFNSIGSFISKIENFKYFSDIISINILKEKEDNKNTSSVSSNTSIFSQFNDMQNDNKIKQDIDIERTDNLLKGVIEVVFYIKK